MWSSYSILGFFSLVGNKYGSDKASFWCSNWLLQASDKSWSKIGLVLRSLSIGHEVRCLILKKRLLCNQNELKPDKRIDGGLEN
jgi:hypothetical protein